MRLGAPATFGGIIGRRRGGRRRPLQGGRRGPLGRARRTAVLTLGLALAATPGARAQPQVRTTLEPAVVGLGELAVLTVEIEGGGLAAMRVQPDFELDNLEVVGGPHHATELRRVNGRFSQSTRFVWELRPRRPGPAAVRRLRLTIGETVTEVAEQRIEVRAEPPVPPAPRAGAAPRGGYGSGRAERGLEELLGGRRRSSPAVFLRAELDPPNPWVGQQALYTVWLYTQGDVGAIEPVEVPQFQGLWAQDVPQPQNLRPQWVEAGGERFGRVALLQKALFALAPGTYAIEPFAARLAVQVARLTMFGPLLSQVETVHRATEPLSLVARELPPPPAGFFGAIGRLALDARLEPAEVELGRASTLTVTLSGAGHLEGLPDPTLPPLPRVTVYPPHQESREEVKGESVRGRRSWSFVLVPQRAGSWQVPPVEVTYFDPEAGEYRVARSAPLSLAAHGSLSPAVAQRQPDLHPLRSAALPRPPPRRREAALPVLFAVPWVVGVLWITTRHLAGGGSTATTRRTLRRALEAAAREPRPRQAAAGIEEAWRSFLGHRWHIPPGVPSTAWAQLLRAQGADATAARELSRLADDLHYLRYAPQLSATETICHEVVDRSLRLARRLR